MFWRQSSWSRHKERGISRDPRRVGCQPITMNLQLENKLALVSGSTAGIGLAIAKALAAEGARVIVNGRTEARVKEAIASIRGKVPTSQLEGLALDLSKADAAAQTTKRYPDVDILVDMLRVYEVTDFEQITDAEWL